MIQPTEFMQLIRDKKVPMRSSTPCSGRRSRYVNRKKVVSKCPHNRMRCYHFQLKGKDRSDQKLDGSNCKHYQEYYDWGN